MDHMKQALIIAVTIFFFFWLMVLTWENEEPINGLDRFMLKAQDFLLGSLLDEDTLKQINFERMQVAQGGT